MSFKFIQGEIRFGAFLLLVGLCVLVVFGWACSTAPAKKTVGKSDPSQRLKTSEAPVSNHPKPLVSAKNAPVVSGPSIEIKEDAPSNTVKVFYKRLRENRFRDALALTNLKAAVEGLSDKEVADLGVDFGKLAGMVPENMPINGEIVSENDATVTINMPNEKDGKLEIQQVKLRRVNGNWVMLVADPDGEKRVKKEGNNYFFALRMDVHHEEAKAMLERIAKAQTVYSLQNEGKFADLKTLVQKGYVPTDALSVESTGYKFDIALAFDESTFTATATPAVYKKSGTLSFALKIRRGKQPQLLAKDTSGEPLNG